MQKSIPSASFACLLLALPTLCAAADSGVLDTNVITASRTDEAILDVPNSVSVIDDEEIRRLMVRSTPEMLRDIPGVLVQKTGYAQGSPFIRGFTGFRNLALIDGIRYNNSVFRDGPNQYWSLIDPYGLERIELVKSQGSVLYGSDAIGGVVNALTKSPLYAENGALFSSWVYGRYSSAEDSAIGRLETSYSQAGRFGMFLGVTGKDFGDLKAADIGRQPRTGYDEWDIDGKLEWFFDDGSKLTLFHQQVHQDDAWRTHATIYGISWEGTTVGNELSRVLDQDRWLSYVQLEGEPGWSWLDSYRMTLSLHRMKESQERVRNDLRRDVQGFDVSTWGAGIEMKKATGIGDFTYGASYYLDDIDSNRRDYNADGTLRSVAIQGPVGDDALYHLAGIFLQDRIDLGDDLELYAGARYTYAKAEIDSVQDPETGDRIGIDDSWNNVVGSLRALYRLDDAGQWVLFGGVSQAFRAPNLSDLSRLDDARSNELETPSPGLDPEETTTFELGLHLDRDTVRSGLTYYYTSIDDLIVRTPTGRIVNGSVEVSKQNGGDGHVHGVEAWFEWDLDRQWTLFGSFAWQEGRGDAYPTSEPIKRTEPLSRMHPTTGVLGLRWTSDDGAFWAEALGEITDQQDRLSTSDERDTQRIPPGGTPGYEVFHLRGGWRPTENLGITLALENVFDADYRIHGSGLNEPGRNFIAAVDFRF